MKRRNKKQENLQEHLDQAKASLAIEGLELTKKEEDLILARQRGEITQREFLKRAAELAKNK